MVNKKYLLLAGLAAAFALSPARAQESPTDAGATYSTRDMTYRGESYDVLDSNYVPDRRLEQHRQFLNHQYNFPAKPRHMLEIGVHGGLYNYSGDVPSELLWQGGGYGLGGHIRKALGYTLSLRLDYTYGRAEGLNFLPATPGEYLQNAAWNGASFNGPGASPTPYGAGPVFYNYQSESHQLTFDLIASLSNIKFHKARTGVSIYGFAGFGALAYQTWVNALNENFGAYNFASVITTADQNGTPGIQHDERKEAKEALRDLLDDTYETAAESRAGSRRSDIFDNKTLAPVFSFGVGTQIRVAKRFNISIEDRVTTIVGYDEDLLDGQRLATVGAVTFASPNKDGINYLNLGLNFNLGGGSRAVEPLYWLNPLDYSYGEVSNPRHMILPDPILSDADGDGIADQFDRCPGTPAGVAVDSHGCPMDTDGDGVPDDRDKQLITPTECQPVDADGVGKCPCNCEGPQVGVCSNIQGGALVFASGSTRITPAMQGQLSALAAALSGQPTCRVVITGNGGSSKLEQQRSWDRVNAVIDYMSERNGIDRGRFIFQYGGTGDPSTVTYRVANTDETGPSTTPPPFPNLRRD